MNLFDDTSDESVQDNDVVEADVLIDAPLARVWELVSEPGWWINDGPLGDHEIDVDEDGLHHVTDPEAGTWLVEALDADPMDVVSFRWYPLAGDEFPEEHVTRVEFSLSDEDGCTALHVEESGLSSVSDDEDEARSAYEDAAGLWHEVLAEAKRHLEAN